MLIVYFSTLDYFIPFKYYTESWAPLHKSCHHHCYRKSSGTAMATICITNI